MNKTDKFPPREATNPYLVPDGFMEDSRRQIYARIKATKQSPQSHSRILWWVSSVAAVLALAFVIRGVVAGSSTGSTSTADVDPLLAYVTSMSDEQLDAEIEQFETDPFFNE